MASRLHAGRRVAIAAVVALTLSAPAGASALAEPVALTVSADVTGCQGSYSSGITCNFAVSFGSVSGAQYYTAEVARPDGSTQSLGKVGPGAASLPATYTGNGEYVVTIKAWGDPVGPAKEGVVAKDSSG